MSRLDLIPQQTPRAMDTQSSRHAPSALESKSEGGRAAGQGGFEALLDGFSKEQTGAVAYSDGEAGSLGKLLGETLSASLSSDASPLDALLPDMPAAADSTVPGPLQAGSIVSSLIENLLPKILPSVQGENGSETGQRGSTPFSSPSLMLPMEPSEIGIGNGMFGDRVAVSVQHQETHFKPIVEGFESIWQEGGTDTPALQEEPASEIQTAKKKDPAGARAQVPGSALLQHEASGLENHTSREQSEEEHRGATPRGLDRPGERMEVQKPSAAGGLKNEPVSLPSGTLQQIASAVIEDVSKAATPHAPGLQGDALNRVAVARASAGALRVLNLQLNPVELGLVTIKMRLAGDGIEMELQAENEDTVALLRNDADKLSNLLRASGYRPDTITIQPADNSAHDRGSFQRLQSSPDQGFQQGAAPGQGGSERRQNEHRRDGEAGLPNDRRDDRTPGAGRTGGIYL